MSKIKLTKGSQRLLIIMPIVALVVITTGYFYYRSINRSEDPRVLPARSDFARYDRLMRENRFSQALALLDEIEAIYNATPGYAASFELGVIENNRASVHLVVAETERLSGTQLTADLIQNHLATALKHTQEAIAIYNAWLGIHAPLDRDGIAQKITPFFSAQTEAFAGLDQEKIIARRVDDIVAAIDEMPQRLSVTYTNLGVISRYQDRPKEARRHYEKALTLWQRNHVARNNLNLLLGRPVEPPSIIEKLFPPRRKSSSSD